MYEAVMHALVIPFLVPASSKTTFEVVLLLGFRTQNHSHETHTHIFNFVCGFSFVYLSFYVAVQSQYLL